MAFPYNPKRVSGNWNGIPFTGLMDGEWFEGSMSEDATTEHVGTDGTVSVVLNTNQTAMVKVNLVQGSPTNDALSALVPDVDLDRLPRGPFLLKDQNGTSKVFAAVAWIKKVADIKFGDKIVGREWSFFLEKAKIVVGGVA